MNTPHFKTLVTGFLLAAVVVGAHAEGLYIGGSLSKPDYRNRINGFGGDGGGSGPGLKLYGGYELNPNLSIEGGYFNLGKSRDIAGNGQARGQGVYLDGVGRYEFLPSWSLLGSVGVAEARLRTPGGNDSSPGLKLGVGVEYALNPTTALRLGYDQYHFTSAFDGNANVGQVAFGVKVGF